MFCWSCGERLEEGGRACSACGAAPALPARKRPGRAIPICPACGYRGEGVAYFRRAGHVALLVAATLFTYGIGGLAYWIWKRHDRICPSCGLSWKYVRIVGEVAGGGEAGTEPVPASSGGDRRGESRPEPVEALPASGAVRRVGGVVVALGAAFLFVIGLVDGAFGAVGIATVLGLSGAGLYEWGRRALQRRREALLQRLQRRVLHLARAHQGRLTATDVASELDLSIPAAERVLLSMDDGLRVRSDVTDEGLLVFDFPEIQLRPPRDEGGILTDPAS